MVFRRIICFIEAGILQTVSERKNVPKGSVLSKKENVEMLGEVTVVVVVVVVLGPNCLFCKF